MYIQIVRINSNMEFLSSDNRNSIWKVFQIFYFYTEAAIVYTKQVLCKTDHLCFLGLPIV